MLMKRDDAIKFAKTHWNTVTDDGVFWWGEYEINVERQRRTIGLGPEFKLLFIAYDDPQDGPAEKPVFRKPGSPDVALRRPDGPGELGWRGLSDCAHHISRCLLAGGIKGIDTPSTPKMLDLLQDRKDTVTLAERVDREHGQDIVDSGVLKPGDIIGYYNIAKDGDYGGRTWYAHACMFVGSVAGRAHEPAEGRITCHTVCRFPGLTDGRFADEWHLKSDHYVYTFIHFADEELSSRVMFRQSTPELVGWWQLDGALPVFQYNAADGTSYQTPAKPKSRTDHLGAHESGHWFVQSGGGRSPNVTFTWAGKRTTGRDVRAALRGQVDLWTRNTSAGIEYSVTARGVPARLARPVFVGT